MSVPSWANVDVKAEAAIRKDERDCIADLLEEHDDTLSGFAGGTGNTVKLIAFMLRLDGSRG